MTLSYGKALSNKGGLRISNDKATNTHCVEYRISAHQLFITRQSLFVCSLVSSLAFAWAACSTVCADAFDAVGHPEPTPLSDSRMTT